MTPSKNEGLRSGIEAARANQFEKARMYLTQVLDQEPHNVPAMFWLAYVAPSPQESISLLERILTQEPGNERAQAGIRWAKQRLNPAAAEAQRQKSQVPSTQADKETAPPKITRKRVLSTAAARKRAKKSVLAHRARRTLNPLLAVVVIIGAIAMLSLGIWVLMFGPPATLAAWFPVSIESFSLPANAVSTPLENPASSAQEAGVASKNFTSIGDTIVIEPPQPAAETALISKAAPLNISSIPDAGSELEVSPPPEAPEQLSLDPPVTFIGPAEQLLDGPRLYQPVDESGLAYRPKSADEKWIEVDVTKQRVTAWEGNIPVLAFISSTGLPNTPTVLGNFNIYWKLNSTLMTGPGYYLPEVPYTMYFYAGYALHGAYWHNNFGQPMSHGCVNLSPDNAKKLFEWADPVIPAGQTQVVASTNNPGTLVVVHD